MLQGVIAPPGGVGEWEKGDARCVRIPGSPFAFGVGEMAVSSSSLAATGLKGRGLRLLHHFPDALWAMGDKCVPCGGFTLERVFPSGTDLPPGFLHVPHPGGPDGGVGVVTERFGAASLKEAAEESGAAAPEAAQAHPTPPAAPEAGAPTDTATPEGMDAVLDWCLLRALVERAPTDEELPAKCEELYSKAMLPLRPAGTTVDIKKSGYKKLAKLFAVWEKKGLLTVRAVHKTDAVTAVNRAHAAYVAAAAAAAAASAAAPAGGPGGGCGAGGGGGSAPAPPAAGAAVVVDTLYRSPASLRPVFGELLAVNKERLLSLDDCRSALGAYAASEGLATHGGGARSVVLDELLHGALFGKKEAHAVGAPVLFEPLLERLCGRLNLYSRVRTLRGGGGGGAGEETLQKGAIRNVRVSVEDRHAGRKHLTKVSGMEAFAIDPDEFAARVQKAHSTSCSVAPLPGKNEAGKEVAAQGALLAEIADLLKTQYGLPSDYIDLIDRTKS